MVSFFLLLFIAELVFGGPLGFRILDISVRKVLLQILLLCWVLDVIQSKSVRAWSLYLSSTILGILLLWGFLVPVMHNTDLNYALAEAFPLVWLLLALPLAPTIRNYGINIYLEFANLCISVIALLVIVAWVMATFFNYELFALSIKLFYLSASGDDFGTYIGPMPDGSFRVMWITCLFFPFMFAYKNFNGIKYGWSTLYLLAIYASGTRSFLYVTLFMLSASIIRKNRYLAIFLAIATIGSLAYSIEAFENIRLFEVASELDPDSPRNAQFHSLLRLFSEHPIFGSGFGAQADVIRSKDTPYSYELTYVAMLAKMGMVGFILIATAITVIVYRAIQRYRSKTFEVIVLAGSFFFITATNPYLMNSFGMTILSFMLAIIYSQNRSRSDVPLSTNPKLYA